MYNDPGCFTMFTDCSPTLETWFNHAYGKVPHKVLPRPDVMWQLTNQKPLGWNGPVDI